MRKQVGGGGTLFQAVVASSVTAHEEPPENLNIAQADPVGHGMAVSLFLL